MRFLGDVRSVAVDWMIRTKIRHRLQSVRHEGLAVHIRKGAVAARYNRTTSCEDVATASILSLCDPSREKKHEKDYNAFYIAYDIRYTIAG